MSEAEKLQEAVGLIEKFEVLAQGLPADQRPLRALAQEARGFLLELYMSNPKQHG